MATPKPGRAVRGSTSGRPIMALLDVLGRRSALRLLWELRAQPLNFRGLQTAAETNPGLLSKRLTELREAGIVDLAAVGYGLTPAGHKLLTLLLPLSGWAESWAKGLRKRDDKTSRETTRATR